MTAQDMHRWLATMDLSGRAGAIELGVGVNTMTRYLDGRSKIPRHVALACAASYHRIKPWPATSPA